MKTLSARLPAFFPVLGLTFAALGAGCIGQQFAEIDGTYRVGPGTFVLGGAFYQPEDFGQPYHEMELSDALVPADMRPLQTGDAYMELQDDKSGHILLTQPNGPDLDSYVQPYYEGEPGNRIKKYIFGAPLTEFHIEDQAIGEDCSVSTSAGIVGKFDGPGGQTPLGITFETIHSLQVTHRLSYPQTGQIESCAHEMSALFDLLRAGQSSGFPLLDLAWSAGYFESNTPERLIWLNLRKVQYGEYL